MNSFDAIVIGYGPCGVSTAIYLKRYGHNVCLVGKDMGALAKANKIENYYGIKSISGPELFDNGIKQAKELDIPIYNDEVVSIEYGDNGYIIKGANNIFSARVVMLALGVSKNKFNLASKYEGSGVSYCATCDGFFYRKKKTAIIGSGEYMKHELEVLENIIPDLTIFTNGEELSFTPNENIKIVKEKIISFNGDDILESITTANNTYEIQGCFIANGTAGGFSFAKHLGLALDGNYIVVDKNMQTNILGIYAGGDCVGGLLQVSKAVSDGAIAAQSISKFLKG